MSEIQTSSDFEQFPSVRTVGTKNAKTLTILDHFIENLSLTQKRTLLHSDFGVIRTLDVDCTLKRQRIGFVGDPRTKEKIYSKKVCPLY